jgi:hypothetical protein
MTIFITKFAMSISLLTFIFCSFVTIRSGSCLSGFGTLILLVVVERMLLLGILGFIFLMDDYGFVGVTCSVDQSKLYTLILLYNQSITKFLKTRCYTLFLSPS